MEYFNILFVDGGDSVSRKTVRLAEDLGRVYRVRTAAEARALLDKAFDWLVFLFARRLPDGNGIELLRHARRAYPFTPAAIVADGLDDDIIPGVEKLDARVFLNDEFASERVECFVLSLRELETSEPDPLLIAARAWTVRYDAPDAETDMWMLYTQGLERKDVAKALRKAVSTIRTQERSFCARTGDERIRDAKDRFLVQAVRETGRRTSRR